MKKQSNDGFKSHPIETTKKRQKIAIRVISQFGEDKYEGFWCVMFFKNRKQERRKGQRQIWPLDPTTIKDTSQKAEIIITTLSMLQ